MPAELIAPALAAGNTVVWTPASTTAVAGIALAECVVEADLPPGVFNLVTGPGSTVGDEIARNPGTHGVGFIGSTETGRRVAEAAAGKAAVLELGGNGPVVVLDDADLDARRRGDRRPRASSAPARAAPPASGCSCTATCARSSSRSSRALVAERVVLGDPFADGDDDGAAQQRGRRGEDGRARRRRGRARRDGRARRRARGRLPDRALLAADDPRRRRRRLARRDGGDVRPGRAGRRDRLARAGDRARERVAVRAALGDLHARPREGAPLRGRGEDRLGERQRVARTTGRRTCRSAAAPAPRAASAASAARRRWRRSPSCRPSSSRDATTTSSSAAARPAPSSRRG